MIYLLDPYGSWDDTWFNFYIELSGDKSNADKEILKKAVKNYLNNCFGYDDVLIMDFEVDFDKLKINFTIQPPWSETALDREENIIHLRTIPKFEN